MPDHDGHGQQALSDPDRDSLENPSAVFFQVGLPFEGAVDPSKLLTSVMAVCHEEHFGLLIDRDLQAAKSLAAYALGVTPQWPTGTVPRQGGAAGRRHTHAL